MVLSTFLSKYRNGYEIILILLYFFRGEKQIKTRSKLDETLESCATAPSSGHLWELQSKSCRVGVKGQELKRNQRLPLLDRFSLLK